MHIDVNAINLQGGQQKVRLQEVPDVCPICHRNIHPKNMANYHLAERKIVQAVYRCTRQKCQEIFIATYGHSGSTGGTPTFTLRQVAPKTPKEEEFSDIIPGVSSAFVEIYNQALAAEASGLTEMVGIGLRKSLEFLIKDFAISENPSKGETIRKAFLGKCINDYINDKNVKECAKRAAWLGNDETHYVRKWQDKDVEDLKLLIRLTVNWIENVILTKKYINDMSEGGT
jgi:hypothetical protein